MNSYEKAAAQSAARNGMYSPAREKDACGVGFVARLAQPASHETLLDGIGVLARLEHRGAVGSDPFTGDGAGVMLDLPHELFAAEVPGYVRGNTGVGMTFLPQEAEERARCQTAIEKSCAARALTFLGWRDVPRDILACGEQARQALPAIAQFFVSTQSTDPEGELFFLRKHIEREKLPLYICSLSSRTIIYKGLLLPGQITKFYADLADTRVKTRFAVVHQRFSTNTFPSWERAHPYRMVAHNGEINTLHGNINWMRSREHVLGRRFGEDRALLRPVIDESGSDSGMFDNVLEMLVRTGRALPHAVRMMIPEAWQRHKEMPPEVRAFYAYHACLMEPWDGPAAMMFCDGVFIGATLDRNGLRPGRYTLYEDGLLVCASEAGVLDREVPVRERGRLEPGRMLLADLTRTDLITEKELKSSLVSREPYEQWVERGLLSIDRTAALDAHESHPLSLTSRQRGAGYTEEDLKLILGSMADTGEEPVGSMGNDTPLSVLSDKPQLLFNYFKQEFAQVTNPPIDPLREGLVMSLRTALGKQLDLAEETPEHCRQIALAGPVLTTADLMGLEALAAAGQTTLATVSTLWSPGQGAETFESEVERVCREAAEVVRNGAAVVILSDRGMTTEHAALPSVLVASAVQHHLVRSGLRHACSFIVEASEAREVMHICLLLGYGASAVVPYLAVESVRALATSGKLQTKDPDQAESNYIHALEKGLLKVLSKMGISTVQSYRGAQLFEAIGLSTDLLERYFPGTPSRIEGLTLEELASECVKLHQGAWTRRSDLPRVMLDTGGQYRWRREGEEHAFNPDTIGHLQHAVRSGKYELFKKFTKHADRAEQSARTIRGLLQMKPGVPVPLEEVEPVASIVQRFRTGAMSYGSLSKEAHENLAVAMNQLGGKSNSGEGGEDAARYTIDAQGRDRKSHIKQVASGRFGVTLEYLNEADELQIKIAQGAKPGEGGQLPGAKVDKEIARVRMSTPGVTLISPPPHHDIYSIEDLAQLIFDLRQANSTARISVKLVSEMGVGTIAAGVAKAGAGSILISGDSGGTGASPLGSIRHAGAPWELGLAETHQVLLLNGLRDRVRLETDGQLKTGRDVAMAALLGADDFGFGTVALIASGCVMMRVCHLNTCPVGVATQDPVLRARFVGEPEHVINFMSFVAEELREHMAELGFRTVAEMVGRTDRLEFSPVETTKTAHLNLTRLLHRPEPAAITPLALAEEPTHEDLSIRLLRAFDSRADLAAPLSISHAVSNADRTIGTSLSAAVYRAQHQGRQVGPIELDLRGTAGQSLGAFLLAGITIRLKGAANDHVGKGLSGGRIVVHAASGPRDRGNVIIGNVALYGATSGELFVAGSAGERFAVRNSGATAVVEGLGDHGCEYMTGGEVVILGGVGRNFAAGMSGGVAFVCDPDGSLALRTNHDMVDLEPLTAGDEDRVRELVERHTHFTQSARGKELLTSWESTKGSFVKVMPREYKRALERAQAEAAE